MALGWGTAQCTDTNGQCNCSLSVEQRGGFGSVVPFTDPTGSYTTAGNTLTASNVTYSYCASGNTLTVTPQMSSLTGTVVLQREGTGGAGGMGGTGGGRTAGGGTGGGRHRRRSGGTSGYRRFRRQRRLEWCWG